MRVGGGKSVSVSAGEAFALIVWESAPGRPAEVADESHGDESRFVPMYLHGFYDFRLKGCCVDWPLSTTTITLLLATAVGPMVGAQVLYEEKSWMSHLATLPIDRTMYEPFGAEDKGAEDNVPLIPEPMVFDLVRSLGAQRGECEVNVLGEFPIGTRDRLAPAGFDPFGLVPGSVDRDGIEWAPEIEYAVADGFAIEFELPYENSTLEAYKFATQFTFGTSADNRFIHGTQSIIEPDIHFEEWQLTFLYLAGMKFDRTWSAIGMIGVRPQIEEGRGVELVDGIFNFTLFANLNDYTTIGLESDLTVGNGERTSLLLMPQIDIEITDNVELQVGVGSGFSAEGTEPLAGVRAIYSR